jgi:hypothetical protein
LHSQREVDHVLKEAFAYVLTKVFYPYSHWQGFPVACVDSSFVLVLENRRSRLDNTLERVAVVEQVRFASQFFSQSLFELFVDEAGSTQLAFYS